MRDIGKQLHLVSGQVVHDGLMTNLEKIWMQNPFHLFTVELVAPLFMGLKMNSWVPIVETLFQNSPNL